LRTIPNPVLPSFIENYRELPSFTEFLPSFTEFFVGCEQPPKKRIRHDVAERNAAVDEGGGHFGLGLAHVLVPEEELPVQVGHVDGVHVDDVDLPEAHQRQVLQQLAAQTAGPDHQHLQRPTTT